MKENREFPNVTSFTQVDVQPGGINIQHVENLFQADFLKSMGVEITPGGEASAKKENANDDAIVKELVGVFYGEEAKASEFLTKARVMKDTDICQYVKGLVADNVISDLSCKKDLWEVLHRHGIYKAGYRNWANQV